MSLTLGAVTWQEFERGGGRAWGDSIGSGECCLGNDQEATRSVICGRDRGRVEETLES